MVKHISKIIEESELFSMLQEHQKKKLKSIEEFLPGISEKDITIGFEGYPISNKGISEQNTKKVLKNDIPTKE